MSGVYECTRARHEVQTDEIDWHISNIVAVINKVDVYRDVYEE